MVAPRVSLSCPSPAMLLNPFVNELSSALGVLANVTLFEPDESYSQLLKKSLPVLIRFALEVV